MRSLIWPSAPERLRDALLILLAGTTGVSDATAFERLGHVFASVMTGNLVLLGISAASRDGATALFAGCAISGYALGVLLTAPRRLPARGEGEPPLWPAGVTLALLVDLALLVAFSAGWELGGRDPGRAIQFALLAAIAAAMGVQSAAVRRIGSISTTYLTGTMTSLLEAVALRRFTREHRRSLAILLMAFAGAAVATLLIEHARAWLPAPALLLLIIVIVASRRLAGVSRSL